MPTANNAIMHRYYPRLSEVMTVDDLPDFLSFAKEALNDLLDSIYYKNLQFSKGRGGNSSFYSLISNRQYNGLSPFRGDL